MTKGQFVLVVSLCFTGVLITSTAMAVLAGYLFFKAVE